MTEPYLLDAFPAHEHERIRAVLLDLQPGLTGRHMLVGGAAIRYGLLSSGAALPDRPFNDLDLIADGEKAVDPLLTDKFAVHHYHHSIGDPYRHLIDFRLVLVHLATATKVDIFHWKPPFYCDVFPPIQAGDARFRVQSISTQFAVTVFDLETMRRRGPVDPKQLADARAMRPHINLDLAIESWNSLFDGSPLVGLLEALKAAQAREGNQADFADKPWQSHNISYRCAKCVPGSSNWPLASMQQVHELLGYVELDGEDLNAGKRVPIRR